jgi:hypothetical protein
MLCCEEMTIADTHSLDTLKQLQQQLVVKLSAFRSKVRTRLVLEGLAVVAAELVAGCLITFILDRWFRLGIWPRFAMLLVGLALLAYEIYRRIILPARMRLGLIALAGALEKGSTGAGDARELGARVASILELPRLLESKDPPSPLMVERAVHRCAEALDKIDWQSRLDPIRFRKMLAMLSGAILLAALLSAIFPTQSSLWARRVFALSPEAWPQATYLEIADVVNNRIAVPRGEPYALRVKARAGSVVPDRVSMLVKGAGKTTVLLKEFAKNDFRHDFPIVDQPLKLWIDGNDDEVGPITLDPVDRPRIVALELSAQHPRDPQPAIFHFGGSDSDLNFLIKTKLALTVVSNVPLTEVRLKSAAPVPSPSNLRRIDPTHYVVEWQHTAPARFDLELVSAESGLVSVPATVSIGLKADQPPRVTVAYTGVRPRITSAARIPLTIDMRDDFGVHHALLRTKDESPDPADPAKLLDHEATLNLYPGEPTTQTATAPATPPAPQKDLSIKHIADVGAMKLPVGTLVSFTVEATDDCYTGPQTGKSRTVTFRIVPAEELFREILLRQQAERVKFRKQTEEAEKIREALRTVSSSSAASELARRHRALQRETLRIATVLAESLTEIKLNGLGSPEMYALMENKVLTPMKALQTELVAPQAEALDNLWPSDGQPKPEALAAAIDREEQLVTRMKDILKQMAQWDSFVDVLNQLDEIIKLETTVKDTGEKMLKKDAEGVFEK